ncbi:hypothetical protein JCM19233_3555 [Vibrio astriarenae]|nr:hypothetical protein JCM19233_3555 [Vibrio sp. C7]
MLDITVPDAKALLTSFVFGKGYKLDVKNGRLSLVINPDYETDAPIYESIAHTNEVLEGISTEHSNWLIDFAKELDFAKHYITKWWDEVVNANGEYPYPEHIARSNSWRKQQQRTSHVLTQVEASFVTAVRNHGYRMVAIIHDGITVTDTEITDDMQRQIEHEIDVQWGLTNCIKIDEE